MSLRSRFFHEWIPVVIISALSMGCAAAPARKGSQPVGFDRKGDGGKKVMTQVELQEALQRFCSNFAERIGQAGPELYKSSDPRIRKSAMQQVLLYQSSALDITM